MPPSAIPDSPLSPPHESYRDGLSSLSDIESSDSRSSPLSTSSVPSIASVYQQCLEFIQTGPFQLRLLILCGVLNASDAVEILSVSFLLPSAAPSLGLSDSQKGALAASIFAGMIAGGLIIGAIGDRKARKWTLFISLLVNAIGGFLSSFARSFDSLLLARLLAGIGVGGSIPILFTYFIEFLPISIRGRYMVYVAWFWMLGAVFTSALAWAVLSSSAVPMANGQEIEPWRLFTALCSLPAFGGALALLFFPESPRFLLGVKDVAGAAQVLKNIANQNRLARIEARMERLSRPNSPSPSLADRLASLSPMRSVSRYQPVEEPALNAPARPAPGPDDSPIQTESAPLHRDGGLELETTDDSTESFERQYTHIYSMLQEWIASDKSSSSSAFPASPSSSSRSLSFHSGGSNPNSFLSYLQSTISSAFLTLWPLISPFDLIPGVPRYTSLRLSIVWFSLAFGFYGFTLWLPQYLTEEEHRAARLGEKPASNTTGTIDIHIFLTSLLSSLSNLPGNMVSTWSVERVGRIKTLLWSMILSSAALALVPLVISTSSADAVAVTILVGVFSAVSTAGWNALNLVTTELFPAALRSSAYGLFASMGRFGAIVGTIVFGELISVNAAVPVFLTAFALITGAVAVLNLQETKGKLLG